MRAMAQTEALPGAARSRRHRRELPGAVLFACTMNTVRSVMAAAILRHLAGKRDLRALGRRAGRHARSVRDDGHGRDRH